MLAGLAAAGAEAPGQEALDEAGEGADGEEEGADEERASACGRRDGAPERGVAGVGAAGVAVGVCAGSANLSPAVQLGLRNV